MKEKFVGDYIHYLHDIRYYATNQKGKRTNLICKSYNPLSFNQRGRWKEYDMAKRPASQQVLPLKFLS